jgi:hypothetical protein
LSSSDRPPFFAYLWCADARFDFWLIAAPLSMLAGWLTVASAINTLTVLTAWGDYPLPIAWGLAAVWVAGQTDRPNVAILAAAGAAVLVSTAVWVGTHRRVMPLLPLAQ